MSLKTVFAGTFVDRALGLLRPAPAKLDRSALFTDFEQDVLERLLKLKACGPDGVPIVGVKASPNCSVSIMFAGLDKNGLYRKMNMKMNTFFLLDRHYMADPNAVAEAAYQIMAQNNMEMHK